MHKLAIGIGAAVALGLSGQARAETCRADIFAASDKINQMTAWVQAHGTAAEQRAYNSKLGALNTALRGLRTSCGAVERRLARGGASAASSKKAGTKKASSKKASKKSPKTPPPAGE